ncbi:hypothetical protein ACFLYB_04195 [Chloroflexota bacterium]
MIISSPMVSILWVYSGADVVCVGVVVAVVGGGVVVVGGGVVVICVDVVVVGVEVVVVSSLVQAVIPRQAIINNSGSIV